MSNCNYIQKSSAPWRHTVLTSRDGGTWLLEAGHILQFTSQCTWTHSVTAWVITLASGTPIIIQGKPMGTQHAAGMGCTGLWVCDKHSAGYFHCIPYSIPHTDSQSSRLDSVRGVTLRVCVVRSGLLTNLCS
jgi:hypothetical protein